MTTPADITRALHRITNSTNIAEARLQPAITNLQLQTADGYPTTTSGRPTTTRTTNELTPTEQAANTNLGHLYGYDNNYRPGPTTHLDDALEELRAALKSLDRFHQTLTNCGIPPAITDRYRCRGINGQGCTDWADYDPTTGLPRRPDQLCIDCGRAADSNRRRLRRHRTQHPA